MDSRWLSHIQDSVQKEEFKNQVLAAKPVLDRLITLLDKDLCYSQCEQRKIDLYTWPNWELTQADHNATQRTLDKIIKLCNIQ